MARLRALVAVLLLSAVLGCEDEPTPDIPDPTPSSTAPTPTETETSAAPEPLTPEETVRAWVDAQNQALRTGETDPLREFGAEECTGCSDYPDGIDQIYDAGGSFEGGVWRFIQGQSRELEDGTTRFSAGIRIAGGTTTPEAGADPVIYETERRVFIFDMVEIDSDWRFTKIAVTK